MVATLPSRLSRTLFPRIRTSRVCVDFSDKPIRWLTYFTYAGWRIFLYTPPGLSTGSSQTRYKQIYVNVPRRPAWLARTAASVRSETPSLAMICSIWTLTVAALITSSCEICRLVSP
jgi:hypothetical protein